ncbi:MAG: type I glyceraldehyde-3-phosphate dehydrogenase [Immundisolibacteraceae bacterium]|nr:type I glyceraldehyde-3-phosphate dehydrogenase [Immundisolibacteraceae bacterium]
MGLRVAINGFGRIGRSVFRAWWQRQQLSQQNSLEIVAVNDLYPAGAAAHLLKFDSNHGRLAAPISATDNQLVIDQHDVLWLQQADPSQLPWQELGIDLVLECSGRFTSAEQSMAHLRAGANKVLVSAPAEGADRTVVFGVNHAELQPDEAIISNGSCTTNCLALVAQLMQKSVGINQGMVTTIHCYTNDQPLQDQFHPDLRRARAAGQAIVPTATGAAEALGSVIPELAGKLTGFSVRVPTQSVSLLDFTFTSSQRTSVRAVNQVFLDAAAGSSAGLVECCQEPLVSSDFVSQSASAIIDLSLTEVNGDMVKVCAWYDNEWGFANRMVDLAVHLAELQTS